MSPHDVLRRGLPFVIAAGLLAAEQISWRELPPLPQGLGGQFVGVVEDRLVVAGGSYWPRAQWDGGSKTWSDAIYVLGRDANRWSLAGRLPELLGYGGAVSTADGLLVLGGQTPTGVSSRVYRLQLRGKRVEVEQLGELPQPLMMMGTAVLQGVLYAAGGQPTPTPTEAVRRMWSVPLRDVGKPGATWREAPAWPGPARFFPQMAATDRMLLLAGGSDLAGTPPVRQFLADAYAYSPEAGWRGIADLPRPAQAGLCIALGGRVVVLGGSDGALALREAELRDRHPGFSRAALAYDEGANQWKPVGELPHSLVTTGIATWGDEFVIAGGEDRPGHRSARVLAGRWRTGGNRP